MRLITLANGPFAVPTLRALHAAASCDVVRVVARPPRGRRPQPSPVEQCARQLQLPLLLPPTVNDPAVCEELRRCEPELLFVCDYGEILRPEVLKVALLGGINLHGSLLPKYRGAAPVAWAIYHGEQETGNSVIQMTPGIDAGPCLGQQRVPIESTETAGELEERLAAAGATLVLQVLEELQRGTVRPQAQDLSLVSRAPRLKKTDGAIDWHRTAAQIQNQIRALQPWPKAYTYWHRQPLPIRLILLQVDRVDPTPENWPESDYGDELRTAIRTANEVPPGGVVRAGDRLFVSAGKGALEIRQLQPAGKRPMSTADFLHGAAIETGAVLGP